MGGKLPYHAAHATATRIRYTVSRETKGGRHASNCVSFGGGFFHTSSVPPRLLELTLLYEVLPRYSSVGKVSYLPF